MNWEIVTFLKSLFRKKTSQIITIILTLVLTLMTIIGSYMHSYTEIKDAKNKIPVLKYIEIISPIKNNYESYNYLANMKHVVDIGKYDEKIIKTKYFQLGKKKQQGNIFLVGVNINNKIKVAEGDNNLEAGFYQLICPKYLFTGYDSKEYLNTKTPVIMKPFITKNLGLFLEDENSGMNVKTNFKIIGLYQNTAVHNDIPICYTDNTTIEHLSKKTHSNPNENYIIEVDYLRNVNEVLNELDKNHLEYRVLAYNNLYYIALHDLSLLVVIIFSLLFAIIIFILFKYHYFDCLKDFKLYYDLGYTKKHIIEIYILNNFSLWCVAFFINLLCNFIIGSILKNITELYPLFFNNFPLVMNYNLFFVVSIFILLIILLASCFNIKRIRGVDFYE